MRGVGQIASRDVASLLGLKLLVSRVICSKWFGTVIGWAYRDRIPFHGARVTVSNAIPPQNKALLFWGLYESAEYRFIRDYLSPSLPVIEAGAGVGAISSVIASLLEPGQNLVCIEGNPNILPLLRGNLANNAAHVRWEVIEGAVGSHTDVVEFGIAENNLCSAAVEQPDARRRTVSVRCVPVSSVLAQMKWPGSYQLVADIEGGEAAMIVDDSDALAGCKRMIIELHGTHHQGTDYSIADLQRMIEAQGFVAVARHGAVRVFERHGEA